MLTLAALKTFFILSGHTAYVLITLLSASPEKE
jgi:hypothetical protein